MRAAVKSWLSTAISALNNRSVDVSALGRFSCISSCVEAAMGKRKSAEEDLAAVNQKAEVDLYKVLGVERTATQQEVRKAYHKLALRLHPDKNPGDEDAKEKFQSLQGVIAVLGDPQKREVYDRTGCVEDLGFLGNSAADWVDFFRSIQITEEKIEQFYAAYHNSKSEVSDLKRLYTEHKGNMHRVFLHMICSEPDQDSHRFMNIIDEAIARDELKEYKAYTKWAKEVSKRPAPQKRKKKAAPGVPSDLVSLIQKGSQKMDSIAASLEAKYASGSKKYKEPTEEEFQAAARRREGKNEKGSGSKPRKGKAVG